MSPPLIVDSHQDLAWNMLAFERDYTRSVAETRRHEERTGSAAIQNQGHTLLGWPEYQAGCVAVVFSTLFVTPFHRKQDWETLVYGDPAQAHRLYRQQLDCYHELVDRHPGAFCLITTRSSLQAALADWQVDSPSGHPVGLVPLMEGADGIRSMDELGEWWEQGVRIIGPAWAATRFCGGTREPGPLTEAGRQLLGAMADIGFTLDISHMDELAVRQALDLYPGPVIASHANAAALIPGYSGNRHLSDAVIRALVARQGVIGLVPSCKFLNYTWQRGESRELASLAMLTAQVDHICQLAGSAQHVGLGSDFDGGFGVEAVPAEFDSIADLQKLAPKLTARGYNDADVTAVLGGNWLQHLRAHLPA